MLGRTGPDTAPADRTETARRSGGTPSIERAIAENRLILVAEDHPTNRMLVLRQLGMLGYAAETAVDGREAFAMWRTGRYGLLLTDCNMPAMDGYQLATAIRTAERTTGRRTPIVALTANALVTEQERCLAAGMDGYLPKPVTLDTMRQTLRRWLDAGPAPTVAAKPAGQPPGQPAECPIDHDLLGRILGQPDPATILALLVVFRDSFEDAMTRIDAAVEARDANMLRDAAHAAKAAAASAAAVRLQAALDDLERSAAAGDWNAVPELSQEAHDRQREVLDHIAGLTAAG